MLHDTATPHDTAADTPGVDLRDQIRVLMESDKRLSQAKVAKEAGMSPATLSQWLGGIYPGDNAAVEDKLLRWVETTQAARAQADVMPTAPAYVPTPSAEKVIAALRYAQVAGDVAVIYGGAGLGKSCAIKRYVSIAPNVFVATMTKAHSSVVAALKLIAKTVGVSASGAAGAADLYEAIHAKVVNTGGLLVIDEAQHLSEGALDMIRAFNDGAGIGVAYVGNEQVYARMTGGTRAAYLDRLFSRIGKKLRLVKSTPADIEALLEAWGVGDGKCRAQLVEIASKPGGLRGLTKVLRLASMYAAAENRGLCCDDVRDAWRELGGVE